MALASSMKERILSLESPSCLVNFCTLSMVSPTLFGSMAVAILSSDCASVSMRLAAPPTSDRKPLMLSALLPSAWENLSTLAMTELILVSLSAQQIVDPAGNGVDPAHHLLGALHQVLHAGGIGAQRRQLAGRRRRQRRRIGAAADEADRAEAGQHRRIELGAGVGLHRRARRHRDGGDHPARIGGIEPQSRHFADRYAVEGDGRAALQAAHRAVEDDVIGDARAAIARSGEPPDESERSPRRWRG